MEYAKKILSQKSLHLLNELIDSVRDEGTTITRQPSIQLQCIWGEEARFTTVSDVMLHEAARLRTKINHLASINVALPSEVLTHIFELGALEDIGRCSQLPVFSRTVSHVCRLWRNISLTSPALWTLYHPRLPPDFTSRAKESLLDFIIQPRKIWATYGLSDIPAFGRQLGRARSLRLTLNGIILQGDSDLMSFPAPHLTTLFLDRTPSGHAICIPLSDQPFADHHSLSKISIRNLAIAWDTPILSCLRALELLAIPYALWVTMSEFMSILRSCPQLQILRLSDSGPILVPDKYLPVEPVVLLSLRSFHWGNPSGFTATKVLLGGIVTRRTSRIRLHTAISDEVEGFMRKGEDHPSGDTMTLLQAISSSRALALSRNHRGSPGSYHILEYDSDTADPISIFFPLTTSAHDRRSLLSNLANCSLSQVQSIALTEMSMDDTDLFVQILHSLPNITAISLDNCSCDEGLVHALADQRWMHRIENFSFSGSDIMPETILDLARSRTDPGHAGLTPLRRLSFEECENILDETLESLRALVPEVVRGQTRAEE
ncbi:hypothetical protein BOTBODRAFT_34120 [Botryobasidium botryosum FD-172 SS1]|uniref:Uncharacterized protein n=1 Tax=Botryobasidium botryosum (strain FD-172 SS1) TaxID=930990 RepID=A0A067ME45_BOTB1|nr:hypothetical protein BOTBODRAFT_34120 [Botryobasidium botryosum FD-172 SS1]